MEVKKILLGTGKFIVKVGVGVVEMVFDQMTQNVKSAYKDNKIDQGRYDTFMESSTKASKVMDTFSKKIDELK